MIYEKALALLNGHIEILEPIASDKNYRAYSLAARHLAAARGALITLQETPSLAEFCIGAWGQNGRAPAIWSIAYSYKYFKAGEAA